MSRLPDPQRGFGSASRELLARDGLAQKVRSATGHTVQTLARLRAEEPRWEAMREHAAAIKRHTLSHLDRYVEELIDAIESRGGHVHIAATPTEASTIIAGIARAAGARTCVKAKSMTSEEIDLNAVLDAAGVQPIETDVGELILQLGDDKPSHITAPAIHLSAGDVERIYAAAGLETRESGTFIERATALSLEARRHLRQRFLDADMGFSGANMLIAERGAVLLVENEGNIRLSTSMPRLHVALAGIEKLVPTFTDACALLSLLAPSATGQRQSNYVSVIEGPLAPDREFHLVLLDAGRSDLLGDVEMHSTLACIRCGACMNHCPVYRQVGGHAYGDEIPGPIGKVTMPLLRGDRGAREELPRASSLCSACVDACPVKIPIHDQLIVLRRRQVEERRVSWPERFAFRMWARMMASPRGYRRFARLMGALLAVGRLLPWRTRALPRREGKVTFRQWWEQQHGQE